MSKETTPIPYRYLIVVFDEIEEQPVEPSAEVERQLQRLLEQVLSDKAAATSR